MAHNLPDFEEKLRDLCDEYKVFVKKITSERDHPHAPQFVKIELSAKIEKDEETIDVMEFHERMTYRAAYAGSV